MNDDFNTPEAMAVLFDLANEVNKTKSQDAVNLLTNLAAVLGLLERNPDEFLQGVTSGDMNVEAMIQARMIAKKNKNFAEADAIRKQLADTGIVLEDTSQGTTWRRT
jgi:cysteinyl-tRNA synthetase